MRFIEYIESTGTQYIDTGFKPNQDTRIVIDLAVVAASAQCALFGARNAYGSGAFNVFTSNNNNGYQDDYGAATVNQVGGISSGRHTIDKNKNVLSVDGEIVNTSTYTSFTGSYSALLLSVNNGGSAMTAYPVSAKSYSAQVYDNGTLVRDFRPCIDDNGVVCMYDTMNETFHYNAGTGEFFGPAKVFMPRIFEPPVIAEPIAVTITRTYSSEIRPIVVNGTSYTSAGTASTTVLAGDDISFTIGGLTLTDYLDIDGTTVAYVASGADQQTYKWIVPDGISSITIEDSGRRITVTTS